MRQPKLLDYLLLVLLALIWASAFFNIKIATYSFGPVTIAFLRVFFWCNPSFITLLLQRYQNRSFLKRLVLVCYDWIY